MSEASFFRLLLTRAEEFVSRHPHVRYERDGDLLEFRDDETEITVAFKETRERSSGEPGTFVTIVATDPVFRSLPVEALAFLQRATMTSMLVMQGAGHVLYSRFVIPLDSAESQAHGLVDLILDTAFLSSRVLKRFTVALNDPGTMAAWRMPEGENGWTIERLADVSRELPNDRYLFTRMPESFDAFFRSPRAATDLEFNAFMRFRPNIHPMLGAGCSALLFFPDVVLSESERHKAQELNQLEFEKLYYTSIFGSWAVDSKGVLFFNQFLLGYWGSTFLFAYLLANGHDMAAVFFGDYKTRLKL